MTELVKGSTELDNEAAASRAAHLLRHYSFDLDECTVEQLLDHWMEKYSGEWVRLAAIEALYQGRYKAISVEQILALWQRRGKPLYHFNHEFERLVGDRSEIQPTAPEFGSMVLPTHGNGTHHSPTRLNTLAQPPDTTTLFSNLGLANGAPAPKLRLQLAVPYQPNWLVSTASKHPIDQFTPARKPSNLHTKLQAVARSPEQA